MTLTDLAFVGVAAAVTVSAQWLLIPLARRYGLLDVPCGRHDHARPTPLVGGVAIFLGVLAACLLRGDLAMPLVAYLVAGGIVVLVGVVDDRRDLSWRYRIVAQACAGLVLAVGGVYATSIGNLLPFGSWAIPFSVVATIGVINAVNMIDGSDGLAGTQVIVSLGYFAALAGVAGDAPLQSEILVLAGAVAGFLMFNLRYPGQPAARVFLGNGGSALLGLSVVWVAFRLAQTPGNASAGIVSPWLVAVPLIDCVAIMLRRMRAGRSPFSADRNHLHHLLRDAGFAPQHVVLLGIVASLSAGTFALVWLHQTGSELPLVLAFLVLIAAHFVWSLRRERAVAQLRRFVPRRLRTADAPDYALDRARLPLRRR
ncbi:MAG TPA: MraY family glycosyltransferase [Tahibacter sp.]|uniref:glycosyltransferase family 4 protein n=1 Tax=Tahibacter sp. TaxID=2056211 RepID=UPI002D0694EC|nr:MraY family glycosyltransferase [Tahibacter sp.]HSX62590.1 MraY family glycosyltransferase [Tahibacter sp.]